MKYFSFSWNGLSLTLYLEENFGESVNGRGGTLIPVNTALGFTGTNDSGGYPLTSLFVTQRFGPYR